MKCVSKSEVLFTLLPPQLSEEVDSSNALFCVYFDQSPITGSTEYYDAVSDLPSESDVTNVVATSKSLESPKKIQFSQVYDLKATTDTSTTGYRIGNKIPIAESVDATTVNPTGYLKLYGSGLTSECTTYGQFALFDTTIYPSRSCVQKITDLSTACSTILNLQTYYNGIFVGTSSAGGTSKSSYTEITVRSDSPSGTTTYNAGATFTCTNAVKSLTYIVTRTNSQISKVEALFELDNIELTTLPSSTSPYYYEQSFSVIFTDGGDSTFVNNTFTIRSGSPGYQIGSNVKSGIYATDNVVEAISERINGFQVYGGVDCTSNNLVSVGFGEDTITSCRLQLTVNELETLCTTVRNDADHAMPYISTIQEDNRLGRFGNALNYNVTDWIRIYFSTRPTPTWTATDSSCSNIGAILNTDIVIARAGSVVNEQWEIIGAYSQQITTTWKFDSSLGTTNDFYIQFRTNFVQLPSQEKGQKLYPVPALLPELPRDVFYPFTLVFGSASSVSISLVNLVVVMVVTLLFIF